MAEEKKNDQVNVDFSKFPELLEVLDRMVEEDFTDRSKFIRKLVSQENGRRQQLELPFPEGKPASRKSTRSPARRSTGAAAQPEKADMALAA